jgi:hypothetical protein
MISRGFSARHWQMIEAGRPITVFTLLRVSEAFEIPLEQIVAGLGHHLRKRKKDGNAGGSKGPRNVTFSDGRKLFLASPGTGAPDPEAFPADKVKPSGK